MADEEWECPRCSNTVQLEDGCDLPEHRLCHGCATVVLDDIYAGVELAWQWDPAKAEVTDG